VTVPPWQEGSEASVLPQSYQDLLEVAADAGRPLRAGEFAAAAGLGTGKAKVEGVRSKLKLLAARGWLAGAPGGLFTLPDHAGKAANLGRLRALLPKFGGATHSGPEEEESSWQRTARFRLMIRSPCPGTCSARWPPSSPARPRPG
jgi:hypothetical protein